MSTKEALIIEDENYYMVVSGFQFSKKLEITFSVGHQKSRIHSVFEFPLGDYSIQEMLRESAKSILGTQFANYAADCIREHAKCKKTKLLSVLDDLISKSLHDNPDKAAGLIEAKNKATLILK